MLKTYQLKWFFILAISLSLSSLLFRQDQLVNITIWHIIYFFISVHFGIGICWMSLGFIITRKVFFKSTILKHLLGILISIFATITVSFLTHYLLPQNPLDGKPVGFETRADILTNLSGAVLISLICYVVFYGAHTTHVLQTTRLEKERLEHRHVSAQLISLQQQISPHFLFNSLSTLKTMVSEHSTRNYIVQIANVYRYVLRINENYLTPLKEELKFIQSYLYILNERFEEALLVSINVDEQCLDYKLPPMSLQLLVENAIKHNIASPEEPLKIRIYNHKQHLLIIENNLNLKTKGVDGTGIGLRNIIERYRLLSGKEVEIVKGEKNYAIKIPLIKNESSNYRR